MTNKEKLFVAALLDLASDEFANHGCNDLSEELEALFTQEEWDAMNKEYHEWNGDPEEFIPGIILSYDWLWMSWMAEKLRKEAV